MLADLSGKHIVRGSRVLDARSPESSGEALAAEIRSRGGHQPPRRASSDFQTSRSATRVECPAFPNTGRAACAGPPRFAISSVRRISRHRSSCCRCLSCATGKKIRRAVGSMPGVKTRPRSMRCCATPKPRRRRELVASSYLGFPRRRMRTGSSAWDDNGAVQVSVRAPQEGNPGAGCDHGCLHVRVHRFTDTVECLRDCEGRQRRHARAAVPGCALARARGRRYRGAERHDGWESAGDPLGAGRCGSGSCLDTQLRREVRIGVLRAVSRGGGVRTSDWRSPRLPDGPRQRAGKPCAKVLADIDEGADAVMVKPAGPYLDIVSRVKPRLASRSLRTRLAVNTA